MIIKKDKRGVSLKSSSPVSLVVAISLGIILLVFFSGGGLQAIYDISRFISNIPAPVWVILGIMILFKMLGGKK